MEFDGLAVAGLGRLDLIVETAESEGAAAEAGDSGDNDRHPRAGW